MTREERERLIDRLLVGYEHLGELIVADDQVLYRLLQTLELSGADSDLGEYLCSFLTV